MATVTPNSVESVVEGLAAKPNGYPFGASYIAQLAGVDIRDAYAELEQLAARKDLERHFELISPSTGKALAEFRLGDKVRIGDTCEPVGDDEAPFVISDNDIWVSFSPTTKLRARVAATQKKKTLNPAVDVLAPASPPHPVEHRREDTLGGAAPIYVINNGTLIIGGDHRSAGRDLIIQEGDNPIAQTGDAATAQSGDNATATTTVQAAKDGGTDGAPPKTESKIMRGLRALAFCVGIVLLVLGAVSVIDLKLAIPAGIVLMGGSAGGPFLKAVGVGGDS